MTTIQKHTIKADTASSIEVNCIKAIFWSFGKNLKFKTLTFADSNASLSFCSVHVLGILLRCKVELGGNMFCKSKKFVKIN